MQCFVSVINTLNAFETLHNFFFVSSISYILVSFQFNLDLVGQENSFKFIFQVNAERSYHQHALAILERLQAEVCLTESRSHFFLMYFIYLRIFFAEFYLSTVGFDNLFFVCEKNHDGHILTEKCLVSDDP